MDSVVEQIMLKLPTSKTELSADNIKKIHRYLPVPSDYKILWADILSFGGYPAGIVITDKGLIIKSTKEEKAVVIRLAGNQKQIEVANDLKISQAKVSVIKKKNDAVLRAIIASAVPLAAILRKISNNNN